ncbi:ATPase [Methylovirgula ligni]|uniref:Chaperone required for assembly of F1-ATPase n=1 Tax=Methylovirgula ligni TaxID=569860 RepID=A0A3D9YZD5_9HYPH|nr:ATP12 family protein [Methylovirgula ligni]QAY96976.1 ATPase [Methylovirgula ligni]REF87961.1 chaperone required for assembly of F1-ATPase [Methylovirgula ligni]
MREDLTTPPAEPSDPIALARRDMQKPLPQRFYKEVGIAPSGTGFALVLDGRVAKTPAKSELVLPSAALAEAVAGEWRAQGDKIDFATMPLTRLAFTAIDGVAHQMDAVIDEIAKYAETDLVCYRAAEPASLAEAQAAAWDPVLDFAAAQLGARFFCAEGVVFVAQPPEARAAVRARIAEIAAGPAAPFLLASLSVMTALAGSILIALALAEGSHSLDQAWAAAHVDEDFQVRQWGTDSEATARRSRRFADMAAAETVWKLSQAPH